jgi:hypothetical protein
MNIGFWQKNVKEEDHLEDQGVHRIHLAQDKDKWWAVENTVMKTRVLQDAWNCCD